MILKNVASQGVYLFAYNSSGPKTGDAGNITGAVSIDGAAAAAFTTTHPTEINTSTMPGVLWQPLAQSETNGNALAMSWASTTAGVSIDPVLVLTSGVNLPTAAPAASGGLLTYGNSTGQLNPSGGKIAATLASTDVSGNIAADLQTIKTQTVTASGGVTFPAAILASTTGPVGSVTGPVASVTGNVGGNVVGSVNSVVTPISVASNLKKGQALSGFEFYLALSSDHISPATGKTVTATRSLDGGAFAACTNSPAEIGNGWYYLNLSATDTNCNVLALSFAASGCDTTLITLVTQP